MPGYKESSQGVVNHHKQLRCDGLHCRCSSLPPSDSALNRRVATHSWERRARSHYCQCDDGRDSSLNNVSVGFATAA
jgi:hypothetical protein